MMTYEECVRANYFDPESWAIFFVGFCLMLILLKFRWAITGVIVGTLGFGLGAAWMYLGYELNCVELWTG